MTLVAYEGSVSKANILKQLRAHAKADELVKGKYWEKGRGCAVGCTIHGNVHAEYEPRFGIPQMLAMLEDTIFEGLPNGTAKAWPVRFMSAIKPGSDLSLVGWRFLAWLLTDEKVNPGINHPLVRDAVKKCADLMADLAKGKSDSAYSACSAAYSADSAAYSAAYSAYSAADSAYSAADSAAYSAYSAAYSAADSAADSAARSACSARSAADSAYSAYALMADKLIALLKAAPMAKKKGARG